MDYNFNDYVDEVKKAKQENGSFEPMLTNGLYNLMFEKEIASDLVTSNMLKIGSFALVGTIAGTVLVTTNVPTFILVIGGALVGLVFYNVHESLKKRGQLKNDEKVATDDYIKGILLYNRIFINNKIEDNIEEMVEKDFKEHKMLYKR